MSDRLEILFIASMCFIATFATQSVLAFTRSIGEGIASLGPLFVGILVNFHFKKELKLRDQKVKT